MFVFSKSTNGVFVLELILWASDDRIAFCHFAKLNKSVSLNSNILSDIQSLFLHPKPLSGWCLLWFQGSDTQTNSPSLIGAV